MRDLRRPQPGPRSLTGRLRTGHSAPRAYVWEKTGDSSRKSKELVIEQIRRRKLYEKNSFFFFFFLPKAENLLRRASAIVLVKM